MPLVEFEPTISAFERVKIDHALDRAATVIGYRDISTFYILPTRLSWYDLGADGLLSMNRCY
jgi:hypothetical protein